MCCALVVVFSSVTIVMLADIIDAAARHVDKTLAKFLSFPEADRLHQRGHHARVLGEAADPSLNRAVSRAASQRSIVFPDDRESRRLENNYVARHAPGFLSPDKSLADAIVSPNGISPKLLDGTS
jgi:hypothetical protein